MNEEDYKSEHASIADYINVYLREKGLMEITDWTMQEIKKGIDRVAVGKHTENARLRKLIEDRLLLDRDFAAEYESFCKSLEGGPCK
jgi:hypothetical protein